MEYTKSNGQKAMVLASFHPAYLLRTPGQKAKAWSDVLRLYKQMNSEKSLSCYQFFHYLLVFYKNKVIIVEN